VLDQDADAAACYSAGLALAPRFAPLYFKRGLVLLRQGRHAAAKADLDAALADRADFVEARIDRALAALGLGRPHDALADLDAAVAQGCPYTRVYFLRARVRESLGDAAGARQDRATGLRLHPADEASWVARAQARAADEPAGALADLNEALRLNPRSRAALQNRAHVLAERLGRPEAALADLDRLLTLWPDDQPARRGRAVLLARLGRRAQALREAEASLARDGSPAALYQAAGVYALTSRQHPDDRWEALQLLSRALRAGHGRDLVAADRDLDPLRGLPEFRVLLAHHCLPDAAGR
jgi:tetratricopeptide (TPR) repeat protein